MRFISAADWTRTCLLRVPGQRQAVVARFRVAWTDTLHLYQDALLSANDRLAQLIPFDQQLDLC